MITFFFFGYLIRERGYDNDAVLFTMAPVILVLAGGYFLGGALGDILFKRNQKGRILISCAGVLLGAIFLALALQTPVAERSTFFVFMLLTALFMPWPSTNVVATVFDITVPEVRSSAHAVEYFIENSGAALAPAFAGALAVATDLKTSILVICSLAWAICFILYLGALFFVEDDIKTLRLQMADRARSN